MLAQAGAKVAVGYRSRKPAADRHVTASVRGDLGTPAGASKAVAEALRALGGLDILVINHGVWPADDVPVAKITEDRKSTRLNSSHRCISYAVFCLKKKNNKTNE